jgi:hypothetical protein
VVVATQAGTDVASVVAKLGEVLADAETTARAGDHDGANVVAARGLERSRQRLVRGGIEGIQDVGSVQRDRQNRALACCFHFGHAREPKSRRRPTLHC